MRKSQLFTNKEVNTLCLIYVVNSYNVIIHSHRKECTPTIHNLHGSQEQKAEGEKPHKQAHIV